MTKFENKEKTDMKLQRFDIEQITDKRSATNGWEQKVLIILRR